MVFDRSANETHFDMMEDSDTAAAQTYNSDSGTAELQQENHWSFYRFLIWWIPPSALKPRGSRPFWHSFWSVTISKYPMRLYIVFYVKDTVIERGVKYRSYNRIIVFNCTEAWAPICIYLHVSGLYIIHKLLIFHHKRVQTVNNINCQNVIELFDSY